MWLKPLLSFMGSLLPYIFPQHEFQPKRLAGVVVIFVVLLLSVKWAGVEVVGDVIWMTKDTMKLTGE